MDRKLMHYYQHNIGDYARDTGHLSVLEHGIYRLLLDWCYLNEKPITTEQALRVGRGNPTETQSVLSEFFCEESDGWVHKRVTQEIAAYREKAEKNRRNGAKGGRPVSQKNPVGSQSQPTGNPNQEPITNNQEPYSVPKGTGRASPNGSRLPADWSMPDEWAEFCKTERPDLIPSEVACRFADYWHGVAGAKGRKADWLATWRNWVRAEKKTPVGASGGLETAYQRSMRERMQEAAPEFARKAPGKPAENVVEFFVVEAATKRLEIGNEPSSAVG